MEFIDKPTDVILGSQPMEEVFIGSDLFFRRWGDKLRLKFKPGTGSVTYKVNGTNALNQGETITDNVPENGEYLKVFDRKPTGFYEAFLNNSDLTDIEEIPNLPNNSISYAGMFNGCSGLTSVTLKNIHFGSSSNMSIMFANCSGLKYLDLSTENETICSVGFTNGCDELETIVLDNWTLGTGNNQAMTMFLYSRNLKNIKGRITVKDSLNLYQLSSLTHDSAMNLINGLSDDVTGHTLQFSEETKSTLSEEEIKIAKDKGWNIL